LVVESIFCQFIKAHNKKNSKPIMTDTLRYRNKKVVENYNNKVSNKIL